MIVVLTEAAETDLERVGDAIAESSPARAASFLLELRECCEGLSYMPERFQQFPVMSASACDAAFTETI
ncbi:type II toxin-antitoxin system RelE/ParE family toxin [Methylocystis sp. 9N]|uniref:Type II toxin-antitoxin system RelE/ParE family toxin n=1 Tax=Methylocystis borbori TaxID=3118750 RepID=A0ABU7XDQ1_9HYPH